MNPASGPKPPPDWREAIVGLGSNLGNRADNLSRARRAMADHPAIRLLAESPVYETDPVGVTDQPAFYNQVAAVATALSPEELLSVLLKIETSLGRVREKRWGPRLIDLDLLVYFGETRDSPGLRLPHPRMEERAFVVAPLLDLPADGLFASAEWPELRQRLAALPLDRSGLRPNADNG